MYMYIRFPLLGSLIGIECFVLVHVDVGVWMGEEDEEEAEQ